MGAALRAARMPEPSRLTVRQVYNAYYRDHNPFATSATMDRHRYALKRWEDAVGDLPICELSTRDYQAYRKVSAARGDSAWTTKTTFNVISMIANMAVACGLIHTAPYPGAQPRTKDPNPHVLSIDQLEELYRAVQLEPTWPRSHVAPRVWWQVFVCLASYTGLRRSDLLWGLKWKHIDGDVISYEAGKTGKRHSFPIHEVVFRHLRAIQPPVVQDHLPILPTPKNQRDLRERLRVASHRAGLKREATCKTFRATAISLWTLADHSAGCMIHGTGIPRVLSHYLDRLHQLREVMPKVTLPPSMVDAFLDPPGRQLELF